MNHTASWWTNGGMFVLACLLFVALVRFVYQQWVMEAARDWDAKRARIEQEASLDEGAPSAAWREAHILKPWYVRRAERWEALGRHRGR